MRLPPIAWAGIVTAVVLVIAITAGILFGPQTPLCGTATSAPSAGASPSPAACVPVSPTP